MTYSEKESSVEQGGKSIKEVLSDLWKSVKESAESSKSLGDEFLSCWEAISSIENKYFDTGNFQKEREYVKFETDEIEFNGNRCKEIKVFKDSEDHVGFRDNSEIFLLYDEVKREFYMGDSHFGLTPADYIEVREYLDRINVRIKQMKRYRKKIYKMKAKQYVSNRKKGEHDNIDGNSLA